MWGIAQHLLRSDLRGIAQQMNQTTNTKIRDDDER